MAVCCLRVQVVPSRNMRVSASSGNEVDVEAIVSDLQEKVRLVASMFVSFWLTVSLS
jgi:hypothetical protein